MSAQPWYRHHARDFLDGIVGMTPDLIGAYIVTLDLIYARGGPIPNDARWISGTLGCSIRATSSLVEKLVSLGKLHLIDGQLTNVRAANEIENGAKLARKAAETGANGGRTRVENAAKSNKINGSAQGTLNQEREDKIREEVVASKDAPTARGDAEFVASQWNGMAKARGLPLVATLTPERRKAVKARIADHGRDQMTEAIARIGESEFCRTGKWCGFDWMLKPANFIKIIEGNYDAKSSQRDGSPRNAGSPGQLGADRPTGRAGAVLALLAEVRAANSH